MRTSTKEREEMKDIIAKAFGISMLILMVLSLVSFALWGYWL
jgi:hypothetical protein